MTDLRIEHFPEPLLQFRYGQKLAYPRDGLFLFGPGDDTDQVRTIRYGVIGTSEGVRRLHVWASRVGRFIDVPQPGARSRKVEPQHVPFPGFAEAFHAAWPTDPSSTISDIDPVALSRVLRIGNRHEAVRSAVDIFVTRLVAEHNRDERPPDFWFVVIPEFVHQLGRPFSSVPASERVKSTISVSPSRARHLEQNPTLFGEEEKEAEVYRYSPDFRRQLKARLLTHRIVSQVVRETTLTPSEFTHPSGRPLRRLEDDATVAWKLGTGTYYKAGGRPWQLADVRPGVCYVGLVYKRSGLTSDTRRACCAAQMFLTNGDGVVFRGALGPWYQEDKRQYHLDRTAARNLVEMVVGEYSRLHAHQPPKELFIHARSSFTGDEWTGFTDACPAETNLVGVQIVDSRDDLKLFRPGGYPVIRGTALRLDERSAFLWTSGYAPRLDTYMGPETPSPILVRVSRGTCTLDTVLVDVLGLTKINFNSCLHNDRLPVTLKFADAVGDVLVSAPLESEPKLPFKYYI